ncbi:Fat storage-inducing transmembrane protein [Lamellibrachia satsuma]|nr:Fat storage-inducing transmembrane protein [Lamellibrachia satsuma]
MKRSASFPTNRRPPAPGKLPVPQPATVQSFLGIFVMYVCKKVLLADTYWKMTVYVGGVTIGSLFTDIFPFPKTVFADKRNFVNQYFVKLGWGWTLFVLLIFVALTSITYCCGNKQRVKRHLCRLAVATLGWYCFTSLFEIVENATGICEPMSPNSTNKRSCNKAGGKWTGFDISGHVFLLIHCLLTISEEAKCFISWDRITDVIKSEEEQPTCRLSNDELSELKRLYNELTPYIRVLLVVLTLMTIMWEMMLLSSIIYFHNMPQKVCGCGFAVLCWFVTYRGWYKLSDVSPGLPGDGPFKFVKV